MDTYLCSLRRNKLKFKNRISKKILFAKILKSLLLVRFESCPPSCQIFNFRQKIQMFKIFQNFVSKIVAAEAASKPEKDNFTISFFYCHPLKKDFEPRAAHGGTELLH